jgi:endogenous inhibitor of DNA gyrase (YacG/DUF329 family)
MFRCPICKKEVDESELGKPGGVFPFCSPRCKLIDLGRWLDGKYQIPAKGDEETERPTDAPRGGRFKELDE